MSQVGIDKEARRQVIKEAIRQLHDGASAEELTQRMGQVLHGVSATEIAQIEQELIDEGMPREEVQRFCDVHLALFRQSLAAGETLAPAGHPIHTFMEEHRVMLARAQALVRLAEDIEAAGAVSAEAERRLAQAADDIGAAESHYVREENVLFPYLEKHGIVQPPAIMWMEHDNIRELKKAVVAILNERESTEAPPLGSRLREAAVSLAEAIGSHFYKENNVLYPAAMRVVAEEEWPHIRAECDELGYTPFTPEMPAAEARPSVRSVAEGGAIAFGSGTLPLEALEGLLNALPIDITFVDKDDRVRYFNDIADRVFPRAKAVLGRTVQRCHPHKSVEAVNRILDGFRGGRQEPAEFWLEIGGKFVHIRYFPVRDAEGAYLGCLEVMQDVTAIRALKGEKRLL